MSIASVAILSSVIRLQPCRPGGGGKGIAPDPVRVAAGYDAPFYRGVQALARALPPGAMVELAKAATAARSSPSSNRRR